MFNRIDDGLRHAHFIPRASAGRGCSSSITSVDAGQRVVQPLQLKDGDYTRVQLGHWLSHEVLRILTAVDTAVALQGET